MASAVSSSGFAYLCLAFATLHLSTFVLDSQCGAAGTGGTITSAEAPLLHSAAAAAAEVLPPFAAVVVLFLAVALNYHHLIMMGRRVVVAVPMDGAAGNNRRSISRLLMFVLCISVGTLEFIMFGQAAGGGGAGHGAQARALGLAALRALPGAATATFFLGMLIIIAHVRAGGEGGGGAIAGDGPVQGLLLRFPTKVAAGMAAALVGLMAIAVTLYDSKC